MGSLLASDRLKRSQLPIGPSGMKRAAVSHAGEVNAVAAHRQLHIERAFLRRGVKNLHQADIDAFIREDFHRIDFRAGLVLKIRRHHDGRGEWAS